MIVCFTPNIFIARYLWRHACAKARERINWRVRCAPYICSWLDIWASSEYNLSLSILQIFILMLDLTEFCQLKRIIYHYNPLYLVLCRHSVCNELTEKRNWIFGELMHSCNHCFARKTQNTESYTKLRTDKSRLLGKST